MNRQLLKHGHETASSYITMSNHISSSQTMILSGDEDGSLISWSLNGQILNKVKLSDNSINSIICPNSNTNIFYASSGTIVYVFEFRKFNEALQQIELGDEEINQLALNHNETYLASADDSGNIKVYDLNSNKIYKTLRKHTNIASDLSFRPNRPLELISVGFDEMLLTWDVAKSRAFCSMNVSEVSPVDEGTRSYVVSPSFVQTMSLSLDGNLLAIGTENALVQIYDSSKRIPTYSYSIRRHTTCISQVRFLFRSNTHLCTTANDGYIYIWRLKDFNATQITNGNNVRTVAPGNRQGRIRGEHHNIINGEGYQRNNDIDNHDEQGHVVNEGNHNVDPICSWNVSEKINWIGVGCCSGNNYLLVSDTSNEPYIITLPEYG